MRIPTFLYLIRWKNIVLVWLMQVVMFYCYIKPVCDSAGNTFFQIITLLFTTAFALGAGNVINDIYDQKTDELKPNKLSILEIFPNLSPAFDLYKKLLVITAILTIAGYYSGWSIYLPFAVLFVSVLLFLYSRYLKNSVLLGNIAVALLCGISVWVVPLVIRDCSIPFSFRITGKTDIIFWGYIINAFLINLIREIIKDCQDREYDREAGLVTTGTLSMNKIRILVNGIILLLAAVNSIGVYALSYYLDTQNINLGLILLFGPLLPLAIIFNSKPKDHTFSFLSKLIKVYILLGLLLLIFWQ